MGDALRIMRGERGRRLLDLGDARRSVLAPQARQLGGDLPVDVGEQLGGSVGRFGEGGVIVGLALLVAGGERGEALLEGGGQLGGLGLDGGGFALGLRGERAGELLLAAAQGGARFAGAGVDLGRALRGSCRRGRRARRYGALARSALRAAPAPAASSCCWTRPSSSMARASPRAAASSSSRSRSLSSPLPPAGSSARPAALRSFTTILLTRSRVRSSPSTQRRGEIAVLLSVSSERGCRGRGGTSAALPKATPSTSARIGKRVDRAFGRDGRRSSSVGRWAAACAGPRGCAMTRRCAELSLPC